ncbi:HAD-IIIA family hydrolase [Asticcacaulis sp.]|uniref:HAD-IIIA family hydrolase n=1 Tax=Asticcacaulis sp. TaxID=1872648 RepID=UPI002C12D82E|nr:HAD-IIIA family hydrolase [Asticcacaulis sp.]HTM82590.1 HAD-IIIA family hydrolase [Asticcacaulis sp.]
MRFSRQLVILVGGKGTRLGSHTAKSPKPLMEISEGRVFLDYFLQSAVRQGFDRVLMLAGHMGEQVKARYHGKSFGGAQIEVIIEPEPMGTGGAFRFALDRLDETFVAANGDTLFDTNLRALDHGLNSQPDLMASLAVRQVPDSGRFGSVDVQSGRIVAFREKDPAAGPGLINGGLYALRREAIAGLPEGSSSIEADLFPQLAAQGRLGAQVSDGYFLDIGLPDTLERARRELPALKRPALFLDRDGVINQDINYLHRIDDFLWIDGAIDTIRRANDRGMAVIVVTNQSGVARGFYNEADVAALHTHIQSELNAQGAFIDNFYYCPYHADATIDRYRVPDHPDRKPNPGMIQRAAREHNIDLSRSVLIGDQPSDMAAARAAGIKGCLFTDGDLVKFIDAQGVFQ